MWFFPFLLVTLTVTNIVVTSFVTLHVQNTWIRDGRQRIVKGRSIKLGRKSNEICNENVVRYFLNDGNEAFFKKSIANNNELFF